MPLVDVTLHGMRETSSFFNWVCWLSVLLRTTFSHRFPVHFLFWFHSSRLFSAWWQAHWLWIVSVAPLLTLSPFCRITLKSHAGPSFPNVSADPIGLISVPVIPALLLVILRPVVMLFRARSISSGAVMQNGLFQVRPTHRSHHKDFLG